MPFSSALVISLHNQVIVHTGQIAEHIEIHAAVALFTTDLAELVSDGVEHDQPCAVRPDENTALQGLGISTLSRKGNASLTSVAGFTERPALHPAA